MACNVQKSRALWTTDSRHVCLAKPGNRFNKSLEHGLKIERRAANDLQHVGGRGLLLQRLAQLVEQPRVFDGDHRLRRET